MALNIQKHHTVDCKKQNNIPDSDLFELGRQEKDWTQFQQLILIVMSKKRTDQQKYIAARVYVVECVIISLI